MKQKRLRREYYVYHGIQFKYIRLNLLLMFLVCMIMAYSIQQTSFGIFAEKLAKVYPEKNVKELYRIFNSTLILNLLLMVPVIVVATIYLSHRIAGPVFRIEKELSEIARGDFTHRITLRKNDDLTKLAGEINRVVSHLDNFLFNLKANLSQVKALLEDAAREGAGGKDGKLKIENCAMEIEKAIQKLNRFKTRG